MTRVTQSQTMSAKAIYSGTRRDATNTTVAQVIRRIARMGALLIAARLLGASAFGIYALLLTITEMFAIVSGAGYCDFLTREVAKQPGATAWLSIRLTLVRILYLIVGAGVAFLGVAILRYSAQTALYMEALWLALLPRAGMETCQGILRGRMRFSALPAIELSQGVVLLGVTAGVLFLHGGLGGVILAEIAASLVGLMVAAFRARNLWDRSVALDWSFPALMKRTVPFNLYPLIVNVYDRADVLVLSKLASTAAVGVYSMPYRAMASLQIIPSSFMNALLPVLARSTGDLGKDEICSKAMRILYALALFMILGVMLFATPVVHLVLGAGYEGSSLVLRVLIWAIVPIFLNNALNTTLLSAGGERIFLITAAVCTVFNLTANLILVPHFSYMACAAVTVATELLLFGQNLFFIKRTIGSIPFPRRVGVLTVLFLACLLASELLKAYVSNLLGAAAVLLAFAVYLIVDNSDLVRARFSAAVERVE
jgi:O-antigen/teichoic acid export membrane protein